MRSIHVDPECLRATCDDQHAILALATKLHNARTWAIHIVRHLRRGRACSHCRKRSENAKEMNNSTARRGVAVYAAMPAAQAVFGSGGADVGYRGCTACWP